MARTSRSMGKLTPKLSESVKASRARPLHCLVIFPTSCPSFVFIYKIWSQYIYCTSISNLEVDITTTTDRAHWPLDFENNLFLCVTNLKDRITKILFLYNMTNYSSRSRNFHLLQAAWAIASTTSTCHFKWSIESRHFTTIVV